MNIFDFIKVFRKAKNEYFVDKNKAKRESKYIINTELTYVDKYKNNDLYVGQLTLEKKFTGYGILYSRNWNSKDIGIIIN